MADTLMELGNRLTQIGIDLTVITLTVVGAIILISFLYIMGSAAKQAIQAYEDMKDEQDET